MEFWQVELEYWFCLLFGQTYLYIFIFKRGRIVLFSFSDRIKSEMHAESFTAEVFIQQIHFLSCFPLLLSTKGRTESDSICHLLELGPGPHDIQSRYRPLWRSSLAYWQCSGSHSICHLNSVFFGGLQKTKASKRICYLLL